MWLQYDGPNPQKGIIAVIDGKQVPVVIDTEKKVLAFPLGRTRASVNKLYLVNPALRIRQLI
jgi:hypothetical protein